MMESDDLIFTADLAPTPRPKPLSATKRTPGQRTMGKRTTGTGFPDYLEADDGLEAEDGLDSTPAVASSGSNVPEFSVSAISGSIKRLLEGTFGRVRVRGEITELKRYPSGHIYLSLKDEGGKIAGVVWRSAVARLGMSPENGTEIVATGRITAYGERSSYQLVIERMEYAGEGAMLARIEKLRQKLLAEGLFAPERKRALPFLPRRIGVITSRSGAVLHDICTTISRRFPHDVVLWPVAVQGEGAGEQIAAAIEGMNRLAERPDVLIVARGGGSLEDLMAFNDERVVRAAAASDIPLISAVGHETDTTLIDFASDRRAPTPTAAAELAVPLRSELQADLDHRAARLSGGLSAHLQARRMKLERLPLPDLPALLDTTRMRLDDRAQRLDLGLPAAVMRARARLGAPGHHLPPPESFLALRLNALVNVSGALGRGWGDFVQTCQIKLLRQPLSVEALTGGVRLRQVRLEGVGRNLEAVSPKAVLRRGYVLVRDAAGRPVTRSAQLPPHSLVTLGFVDGERPALLDPQLDPELGAQINAPTENASTTVGMASATVSAPANTARKAPSKPAKERRKRGAPVPRSQGDLGL